VIDRTRIKRERENETKGGRRRKKRERERERNRKRERERDGDGNRKSMQRPVAYDALSGILHAYACARAQRLETVYSSLITLGGK